MAYWLSSVEVAALIEDRRERLSREPIALNPRRGRNVRALAVRVIGLIF